MTNASIPSLALVSGAARLLAADLPFADRARDLFELLRDSIGVPDARLHCWFGGYPGGEPARFASADDLADASPAWDAGLAQRVAASRIASRLRGDALDETTIYVAPIASDDRVWGVLELRAAGDDALGLVEQTMVSALLPLLAAAIAGERDALPAAPPLAPAPPPRSSAALAAPASLAALTLSQRQVQQLDVLREQMERSFTLREFLPQLLRWAMECTGAEAGMISTVDRERGDLILQAYDGYGRDPFARDQFNEPRRRVSWEIGVAGRVARTARAVHTRDVSRDPDYQSHNPEIRAELAMPLALDGEALAVLVLDSPRAAAFGPLEIAFVESLCRAAAAPLLRATRYQRLLEDSTQLGQVFHGMPTGLLLMESSGRVLRANDASSAVWGLEPDTIGDPFHLPLDLVPLLLGRLTEPMALTEFIAIGQQFPTETHEIIVRLRAPHQEIEVLSAPTRDTLGQLTGRLWMVRDVTREREADRLKTEFISVVSHELRTPLTSILGYTELILTREFKPADQRDFVKTVFSESNHLYQIVEDLLGVTRLEAGAVRLNQWTVSILQLVNELIPQLSSQLSDERHQVVLDVPATLPPGYVDRDKIKQVLFNLMTNAVKYSPQGGSVRISAREAGPDTPLPADHPDGRFLLVGVQDSGLGIPADDLPKIWERFYRVDNSNTRRIGGTGLGLAIARGMVELHGGRIWAESVVGKGSTFSFTVPVAGERPLLLDDDLDVDLAG